MKGKLLSDRQDHIIPLSTQAVDILSSLKPITGHCRYVFPNERGCVFPMSDGAITVALKRSGYEGIQTWHGFRATARTILEEVLGYDPKYPEMQLAHTVKDANGTAYNRVAFIDQRRAMLQHWADYLDELRLSLPSQDSPQQDSGFNLVQAAQG